MKLKKNHKQFQEIKSTVAMLMSVHVLFWLGKNLILLTLIYPSQIFVIEILHFKSMVDVAFGYDTQKLSFVYPKCHQTSIHVFG